MTASMFLPGDAECALQALIAAQLDGIQTGSIGDLEVNDEDQLVFDPPCIRTRYVSSQYDPAGDNLALAYNSTHVMELWCVAENLASKEAQRNDTLALVGTVLPVVAGATLALADGSLSEPAMLKAIEGIPDDPFGIVYKITLEVPGIAQFPGTNNADEA